LTITVPEIATVEALIAGGHLDRADAEDRAAIEDAASGAIAAWFVVPPDE
jgi:hypothetical protein